MLPTASAEELRAAYRAQARRVHPDARGGGPSPEMAAVNEAWRVLSDPARRAVYDAQRRGPAVAPPSSDDEELLEEEDVEDELELTPAELRASRTWALIFGFTAVVVTVLLIALFVYAFTKSPTVTGPGSGP